MDHNEDIDKEIRISLSIFWDIAVQGGNEVMRYLSNSFIYGLTNKCTLHNLATCNLPLPEAILR